MSCPWCNCDKLTEDARNGDAVVCTGCGCVLDEFVFDDRATWKTFNDCDHDRDRDFECHNEARRDDKWSKYMKDGKAKGPVSAFQEAKSHILSFMPSVPDHVLASTEDLVRSYFQKKICKGLKREHAVAAALCYAFKEGNEAEIASVFAMNRYDMMTAMSDVFKTLSDGDEDNSVYSKIFAQHKSSDSLRSMVQQCAHFIPEDLVWTVKKKALELDDRVRANPGSSILFQSSSIPSINSALIYLAIVKNKDQIPNFSQEIVAGSCGVSITTMNNKARAVLALI